MRLLRQLDDPRKSKVAGKWAIGAYPGNGGGFLSMQEMALFKHSRNPEAAFEFLAYCTDRTAAARLLAEYSETTARKTPWLRDPAGPRARVAGALDRGVTFAAGLPQWLEMLTALWEATSYAIQGYVTPRQALTLAAARWQASLAQDASRWRIGPDRE
jgi:ABC-type glycerol-3-phosphate transport system substrate-binding protein